MVLLWSIQKLLISLLLLIVSRVSQIVLGCALFITGTLVCAYRDIKYAIKNKALKGEVSTYWMDLSIIIDVFGNVLGRDTFNKLFIKGNGYKFGSRKDTISYVLAINNRLKTLTPLALQVAKILDFFDKDHLEKAIANKKPCT